MSAETSPLCCCYWLPVVQYWRRNIDQLKSSKVKYWPMRIKHCQLIFHLFAVVAVCTGVQSGGLSSRWTPAYVTHYENKGKLSKQQRRQGKFCESHWPVVDIADVPSIKSFSRLGTGFCDWVQKSLVMKILYNSTRYTTAAKNTNSWAILWAKAFTTIPLQPKLKNLELFKRKS